MTDLIKELELRVAAKRKELEDEEKALAVVKRMMAQPSGVQPGVAEPIAQQSINFEDLVGSVDETKKRTLIDSVRDVVSQFGANEFTVVHVEAALKRMGVVIEAKAPRARISMVLAKLVEEGVVIKVSEGSGNIPNRYKLKDSYDLVG